LKKRKIKNPGNQEKRRKTDTKTEIKPKVKRQLISLEKNVNLVNPVSLVNNVSLVSLVNHVNRVRATFAVAIAVIVGVSAAAIVDAVAVVLAQLLCHSLPKWTTRRISPLWVKSIRGCQKSPQHLKLCETYKMPPPVRLDSHTASTATSIKQDLPCSSLGRRCEELIK